MALVNKNRVRETANNPGAGTITLSGVVVAGYQVFSVIGDGNTCYYCIQDQGGSNWEVGIGTYTLAGNTLARTTILSSSNAGAIVTFTAGVKDVFVTYPTEKGMWLDANGNANIPNSTVLGAAAGATTTFPDLKALVVTTPSRHSIRPSLLLDFANTRQLDPRITFTRASTATYYDGQTTALAEQNLLLQSQTFGTTPWVLANTSVASGITAPDSTTTAITITSSAAILGHNVNQPSINFASGLTYTYSFYAKSGTQTAVQIPILAAIIGTNKRANFNLSTGALGTVDSGITATIVSSNNGFYRCSVTFTATASVSSTMYIWVLDTDTDAFAASSTASGTLIAWGAQLEQRSAVTAYTSTTTAPITNYIPVLQTAASGVARFDCNPTTSESLGLLIEEQRTNLNTYSGLVGGTNWTLNGGTTATTLANISPDGTQTASLISNTPTVSSYTQQGVSLAFSTTYTRSMYVKLAPTNTAPNVILETNKGGGTSFTTFNMSTLAITGTDAATSSLTPVGNGWYRLAATFTTLASGTLAAGVWYLGAAGASSGVASFFFWGAQVEAGAFPTSYIPTVASQVTRIADAASMTGTNFSSWFNQAQGTFYTSFSTPNISATPMTILGGTSNGYLLYRNSSLIRTYNNTQIISFTDSYAPNTQQKASLSYAVSTATLASNTIYSSAAYKLLNTTDIALGNGTNGRLNGWIQKLSYYPISLTNAELQGLTS